MLPFFYHKDLSVTPGVFNLTEETSKHCIQVLRMQEGERMHLTNGQGLKVLVEITMAHKKNASVKIISHHQSNKTEAKSTIAISLVKNNARFEWFLEKVTEMGIDNIVPLICKRTERQVFKRERLDSILISAMLQSQQVFLPILNEPILFDKYIQSTNEKNKFIAHCTDGEKKYFQSLLQKNKPHVILIGPEGDFDEKEIEAAMQNGFQAVSLGSTRLRTETAGIVAATLMCCCE